MRAFKRFECCNETFYVGVNSQSTPPCSECGEEMVEAETVEIYDEILVHESEPVDTFNSVSDFREATDT